MYKHFRINFLLLFSVLIYAGACSHSRGEAVSLAQLVTLQTRAETIADFMLSIAPYDNDRIID